MEAGIAEQGGNTLIDFGKDRLPNALTDQSGGQYAHASESDTEKGDTQTGIHRYAASKNPVVMVEQESRQSEQLA
jgi:hypothetical protein